MRQTVALSILFDRDQSHRIHPLLGELYPVRGSLSSRQGQRFGAGCQEIIRVIADDVILFTVLVIKE